MERRSSIERIIKTKVIVEIVNPNLNRDVACLILLFLNKRVHFRSGPINLQPEHGDEVFRESLGRGRSSGRLWATPHQEQKNQTLLGRWYRGKFVVIRFQLFPVFPVEIRQKFLPKEFEYYYTTECRVTGHHPGILDVDQRPIQSSTSTY